MKNSAKSTKFPKTTTPAYSDYYYEYDYYDDYWSTDYDFIFFFERETIKEVASYINIANSVFAVIGILLNLLHFLVLTRKDLRTNVVFFIMTAVCICDLSVFASNISEYICAESFVKAREDDTCGSFQQWLYTGIEWYSQGVQKFGRQCGGLLTLSMGIIRAVSVMFPMSSAVNKLTKLKFGLVIVLSLNLICGFWYTFVSTRSSVGQYQGEGCYYTGLGVHSDVHNALAMFDGLFAVTLSISYIFVTILLSFELKKARIRRKTLRSEKPDNTIALIIALSVSFFISQLIYCFFLFLEAPYFYFLFVNILMDVTDMLKPLPKLLLTLNSVTHCFICFFMSSQYKEVALRTFWMENEAKAQESKSTNSIFVKVSKDSKKI